MKNAKPGKFKRILSLVLCLTAACTAFSIPASAGWEQEANGKYWYSYSDGGYATGWQQISGKWYYFDENGYMTTGWKQIGNAWYYLNPAGDMATGWKQIGNAWYYLEDSGAMKTGWLGLNNSTYYFNASGVMLTGIQTIDGVSYTFSASGALSSQNAASGNSNSNAPSGETRVVFWGESGTKYHIDPDCRSFKGVAANSGTLEQAKAAGREDWCGICSKGWTDTRLEKDGNPHAK